VVDQIHKRLDALEQANSTNMVIHIASHKARQINWPYTKAETDTAFIFFGGGLVKGLMVDCLKERKCDAKVIQVGSVRQLTGTPKFTDPDCTVWEEYVGWWVDTEMQSIRHQLEGVRNKIVVMMAAEPDPSRFKAGMQAVSPNEDLEAYAENAAQSSMYRLNVGVPFKVAQWVANNKGFGLLHISTSYVYMELGPTPNTNGVPIRTIPPEAAAGNASGLHPFDQRNPQNGNVSEADYSPYAPDAHPCSALWEGRAPVMQLIHNVSTLVEFSKAAICSLPAHIQAKLKQAGADYPHSKVLAELAVQAFKLNNGSAYTIVRLPTMVGAGDIFGPYATGGAKYARNVLKAMTLPDVEAAAAHVESVCSGWRQKSRNMCSYRAAADMLVGIGMGMRPASPPCFCYEHAAGSYSESDADYHLALVQAVKKIIPVDHPKQHWLDVMIERLIVKDVELADPGCHTTIAMQNQAVDSGFETDFKNSIAEWMEQVRGIHDCWPSVTSVTPPVAQVQQL